MERTIEFKSNLISKRIIFITMLLMIMVVIYSFSDQVGEVSSNISGKVAEKLVSKFKDIDKAEK